MYYLQILTHIYKQKKANEQIALMLVEIVPETECIKYNMGTLKQPKF